MVEPVWMLLPLPWIITSQMVEDEYLYVYRELTDSTHYRRDEISVFEIESPVVDRVVTGLI